MSKPLGWIIEVVEVVIDVAVWVYNWIDASNVPDTWSSWNDATKEKFVTDALNAAFAQGKVPPRDWFWRAVSDAGYSRSDYDSFMAENEWIANRVPVMEQRTSKKWDMVNSAGSSGSGNTSTGITTASLFSGNNLLGIVGGVLFVGIAASMIYSASKQKK